MITDQAVLKDLQATTVTPVATDRQLFIIAREIRNDWGAQKGGVNYAAKPYLAALSTMDKITDNYGDDSGTGVVAYFLSNARTWKGPVAKRVKAELNDMLNVAYGKGRKKRK